MSRPTFVYTIPVPDEPIPGWVPPEPPDDYDPESDGPWEPKHPRFQGEDPWEGQEVQFESMSFISLNGAEEDSVIQQATGLDGAGLTRKLALRSLVEVDGRKVGTVERTKLWKTVPAKIRDLWLAAYNNHNAVSGVTAAMFLGSCQRTER